MFYLISFWLYHFYGSDHARVDVNGIVLRCFNVYLCFHCFEHFRIVCFVWFSMIEYFSLWCIPAGDHPPQVAPHVPRRCRALLRAPYPRSEATPVGFEPTRGNPIGLAGRRLNHSAKVSCVYLSSAVELKHCNSL